MAAAQERGGRETHVQAGWLWQQLAGILPLLGIDLWGQCFTLGLLRTMFTLISFSLQLSLETAAWALAFFIVIIIFIFPKMISTSSW